MNETILILIKFAIRGNLRFLSHADALRLFQRACVRAGIKIRYSRGFNPRPKLSLPLPKSVGIEVDDDLLCIAVQGPIDAKSESSFDAEQLKIKLSDQLPQGCELLSVDIAKTKTSIQPRSATYILTVAREYLNENLKSAIEPLLASENLNLQRRTDAKGNTRNIDVRPFLKTIDLKGQVVAVECKISSAGSIRVDEILKLLRLDAEKLAAPIRRTSVQWQMN